MKHFPRPATVLLLAALTAASAGQAMAFEPASEKLFIDWPDLEVETQMGRETQVYAIANKNGEVIYVITYNVQGRLQPLGAFACNQGFEVLDSAQNGFRDIACINNGTRSVLQADQDGTYLYGR